VHGSVPVPLTGSFWKKMLAFAGPDSLLGAELRYFPGDRASIRSQAVAAALDGTLARIRTLSPVFRSGAPPPSVK
jgi:hypothetical protein